MYFFFFFFLSYTEYPLTLHMLRLGINFSKPLLSLLLIPSLSAVLFALLASRIKLSGLWLYKFVLKAEESSSVGDYCHYVDLGCVLGFSFFSATFIFLPVACFPLYMVPHPDSYIRYSIKSSF